MILRLICSVLVALIVTGCGSFDTVARYVGYYKETKSDKTIEQIEDDRKAEYEATTNAMIVAANARDMIDVNDIIWVDRDISSWEVVGNLRIGFAGSQIIYEQYLTSLMPTYIVKKSDGTPVKVVGNVWIIIEKDGKSYGVTWDSIRLGGQGKHAANVNGAHIKKFHLFPKTWKPTSGTKYGFVVTGGARNGAKNVKKRTPIFVREWK